MNLDFEQEEASRSGVSAKRRTLIHSVSVRLTTKVGERDRLREFASRQLEMTRFLALDAARLFTEIDPKPDCPKLDSHPRSDCPELDNVDNVQNWTMSVKSGVRVKSGLLSQGRSINQDPPGGGSLKIQDVVNLLTPVFGAVNMQKGKGSQIHKELSRAINEGFLTRKVCEDILSAPRYGLLIPWISWGAFALRFNEVFQDELPEFLDELDEAKQPTNS